MVEQDHEKEEEQEEDEEEEQEESQESVDDDDAIYLILDYSTLDAHVLVNLIRGVRSAFVRSAILSGSDYPVYGEPLEKLSRSYFAFFRDMWLRRYAPYRGWPGDWYLEEMRFPKDSPRDIFDHIYSDDAFEQWIDSLASEGDFQIRPIQQGSTVIPMVVGTLLNLTMGYNYSMAKDMTLYAFGLLRSTLTTPSPGNTLEHIPILKTAMNAIQKDRNVSVAKFRYKTAEVDIRYDVWREPPGEETPTE